MTTVARELLYVLSLTVISFIVSKYIWLLPIVLFLPLVLTYTVDSPLIYLVFFGGLAELFTFLPPGVMFGVVFLPWLVFRGFGRLQVDMSFKFGVSVLMTIILQVILIYSPDLFNVKELLVIPWSRMIPVILFTSTVSFLTSVAIFFNRSA